MTKKLPKHSTVWWIFLLEGIIQLVLGFLLLLSPDVTVLLLVEFLGIYWLIRGIIMIIRVLVTKERNKGWMLLGGIIGIIAGIIVLRYPLFSAFLVLETMLLLVAFVGLIQGTISIVQGIGLKSAGEVILGVILCLICLVLLFNPISALVALPVVIGILWIIGGTALTVMALTTR